MENQVNSKMHNLLIGLASIMSALFFISPPFEKNPQQCEMVQTIGKRKPNGLNDEDELVA
ncbi:hypothetical protein DU508_21845 [Pedobacter chinensis]|uniref:Uncharacterized protein n=1 Tax=Pedobacter chinensis TaxID=2282421 RepID=A0A369PTS9_9SPHI|nr:hypothetical protein [Pedobacter chinensis]RDC54367.1 hypothetical protein DU508_21845 [Pedobacter chinensis]